MFTPAGNSALNRSEPERLNSEKYGSAPQPTTRLPSWVVWALPCDGAERPSGWSSEASSVAVLLCGFSLTVTARLYGSSGVPEESLSKNVYTPSPNASGSCCQAKISPALSSTCPGPATSLKLESLPPSCQMMFPLCGLTS